MYNKSLLVATVIVITPMAITPPLVHAQRIHITIPWRSEMTPVQRLNREGVEQVEKHKYDKAEGLFYKAYLFDPADPFTLNNLGYISELQGQVDRAADYYKLAVEQGCDAIIERSTDKHLKGKPMMDALGTIKNIPMRINRVNIYAIQLISQGRGFDAEAVLKQFLPLDPHNPFTLNNLGVAEESVGDLEDALTHYDAAASVHSTLPVIVSLKPSSRGKPISLLASKSAAELRTRMATMDLHQIRANMYAIRGVSALNKNDFEAARKDFEESISEDPENAFALNNAGYLAEKDGELETAMSFYARAQRAPDASYSIGAASQATARGQQLASVARESYDEAGEVLNTRRQNLLPSSTPIELIRRDGSPEPPVDTPTKPSDKPASPAASPRPQAPASSVLPANVPSQR